MCLFWFQVPTFQWVSCVSLPIADAHAQWIRMICVSLLISSAYVSVSILCVSSDRRCSRTVDPDDFFVHICGFFFESSLLWWYCRRHVLAHVIICCGFLSLHSVIASGCVNGCAYVSSRFLWVTCVSLLISSAYVSVSLLCVSSDRRCSRTVDPDDLCVSSDFKCLRFSEYLVCLFWSQMLTHSGSGWFLCTYLWHQMYSDAQVGNLFVSSDGKYWCLVHQDE